MMIRFDCDLDVNCESPEKKAFELYIQSGWYDFFFEFDLNLYRCKINKSQSEKILNGLSLSKLTDTSKLNKLESKIKIKHVCSAVPNLLQIEPKSKDKFGQSIYHYFMKIYSRYTPEGVMVNLPGNKFGSYSSFKTMLPNKVPCGFFGEAKVIMTRWHPR